MAAKKKPIKRKTAIRRKSVTPEAKLKARLMALAKKYIKLRDKPDCWTCPAKNLSGHNLQGGHFIRDSVGGVVLRYHEDNIHPQCARCNLFLDGNEAEYYITMVKVYGQEFVDGLFKLKHSPPVKWSKQDYLDKIEYYEKKIAELNGK